jgi:hypothetical protein
MMDLSNPIMTEGPALGGGTRWWPDETWKHALLIDFGKRFNISVFLETGTFEGDTPAAVKGHFEEVYSIELSPKYQAQSAARFASDPHVHIVLGSSSEVLPEVIDGIRPGPILFYLDAHVHNGGGDRDQVPAELVAIDRHRPESLVVIDDVSPRPEGGGYRVATRQVNYNVSLPAGWEVKFLSGLLVAHKGTYSVPDGIYVTRP